ncbi:MAG: CoB--CoM heterodisulfide reductase iron-sulfur subunit A family protein [Candidatus Thorarchaeota archaeon]|nr:CoB--CoM heterodisulfide reductase iron-sulfur subunit A family protein [Candidatus Thorarchaeota archaeon]
MTEEKKKSKEPLKIGVYVCHCGGNISDVVDVKRVAEEISHEKDVVVSKDYIFMCSDPGQELIAKDIKEQGLNRVIVASCSPDLHEATFMKVLDKTGLNKYLYMHVNIREQDSWVHSHEHEKATEKAIRLIRGAIAGVRHEKPLEPIMKDATKHALVIGGGISGITAALDLAERGIAVDLIEKQPFLGGRITQLTKLFPTDISAKEVIHDLIDRVKNNSRIKVRLNTEVISGSGSIGSFHVTLRTIPRGVQQIDNPEEVFEACPVEVPNEQDYGLTTRKAIYIKYPGAYPDQPAIDWKSCTKCGKCVEIAKGAGISLDDTPLEEELTVGAIIMATGFKPYEPAKGEFAYGETPFVVTLPEIISILEKIPEDQKEFVYKGKAIKNVTVIHCVGSRQIEGVHEPKDGRLNTYCSRYCCTANLRVANELKDRFPKIHVYDLFRDIRTHGIGHEAYYINASKKDVIFLKYPNEEPPIITIENEKITIQTKDLLFKGREVRASADLVVLVVGMEPEPIQDLIKIFSLPTGKDGFLQEVHPKLKPVESSVDGIFIAGTAQAPMDSTESIASASAAASKAANILTKDQIALNPFIAEVDYDRCEGHALCVPECPYGAISLTESGGKKKAKVEPSLCVGCGACVPVCPTRAITLKGWDLEKYEDMVAAMIKEVE